MNSGKRDRYIIIQTATYTQSDITNDRYPSSWATYKSVWAQRIQTQSNEPTEGNQFVLLDVYKFRFPYYDAPDITSRMRISDDSVIYNIIGLKKLGRNDGWEVMAEVRDNG